jgi:hypothetical protein
MAVKLQVASEGMWDYHNEHLRSVFHVDPLLDHAGAERRQVVQKVTVLPEDFPQFGRHREYDTGVGYNCLIYRFESSLPNYDQFIVCYRLILRCDRLSRVSDCRRKRELFLFFEFYLRFRQFQRAIIRNF